MKQELLYILFWSCLPYSCHSMSNQAPKISSLAQKVIANGIKPLKIWPVGDVDFPNNIAITQDEQVWHHHFVQGLGIIYTQQIQNPTLQALLKLMHNK